MTVGELRTKLKAIDNQLKAMYQDIPVYTTMEHGGEDTFVPIDNLLLGIEHLNDKLELIEGEVCNSIILYTE